MKLRQSGFTVNPEEVERLGSQGYLYIPGFLELDEAKRLGESIEAIGIISDYNEGRQNNFGKTGISSLLFEGDLDKLGEVTVFAGQAHTAMNAIGATACDETFRLWVPNTASVLRYMPGTEMAAHHDNRVRFLGGSIVVNATEEAEVTIYTGDPANGGAVEAKEVMTPGGAMIYIARPIYDIPFAEALYLNTFRYHSVQYDGKPNLRSAVSYDWSPVSAMDAYYNWVVSGDSRVMPDDVAVRHLYREARRIMIEEASAEFPELKEKLMAIDIPV